MFKRQKDESTRRSVFIPAVTLSAFFGLAAGIVGMLMMLAYFPLFEPQSQHGTSTFAASLVQIQASRNAVEFTIKDIASSSALLFRAEDVGEITLITNAIGSGTVLTSDGWILSHSSILDAAGRPSGKGIVVVIAGVAHAVEKTVVDSYTDVAFLKVDGSGLPVASFGQSNKLAVGSVAFAFDAARGLREATVIDVGGLPAEDVSAAIRSSEEIQEVVRLSGTDGFVAGSALLNHLGEVVGIYVGEQAVGAYAIPIDSFFRQIGNVLRDGEVSRPYLGVHFLDLSEHPSDDGLTRGARLRSNVRWPAVLWSSPAATAGLRSGDVIKAINDEQITANKSLSNLLVDYEPGETVTMTVLRLGKEIFLDVTLAKIPAL